MPQLCFRERRHNKTLWNIFPLKTRREKKLEPSQCTESPVECAPNRLHLTFCEPDAVRFREERLKVLLGPLGSMLKTQSLSQNRLKKGSSATGKRSGFSSSVSIRNRQKPPDTHYRTEAWRQPLDSHWQKKSKKWSKLHFIAGYSASLSSLRLTPDWQDRDPSQGYKSLDDTLDT